MSLWGMEAGAYAGTVVDITQLQTATYTHTLIGGPAIAGFKLLASGIAQAKTSIGGYTDRYDWVFPNSSAALYECRHVDNGTAPDTTPGASGTWLALTSNRIWETTSPVNDIETRLFTCELRLAASPSVTLFSVTITLVADGQP